MTVGWVQSAFALLAASLFVSDARAAGPVISVDVPLLSTASSALGFEFLSLQFDLYVEGRGDPGNSDYAANVLANDHEYYSYLRRLPCGGGKGGGQCPDPPYARTVSSTFSDNFQPTTQRPGELQAMFHFSGADLAGKPLRFSVLDRGTHSLTLTEDSSGSTIAQGAPLSSGLYTLAYRTDSLLGARITVTSPVPEPTTALLWLPGLALLGWALGRTRPQSP
jgi:hypothetical protein